MKKYLKSIFKAVIIMDCFLILYFIGIFIMLWFLKDLDYATSELRFLMGLR